MRTIIAISCLLVINSYFVSAQVQISTSEASRHIGDTVDVCGKVFSTNYLNAAILLNIGGLSSNVRKPNVDGSNSKLLAVIIPNYVRNALKYDADDSLNNKVVCVTGKLEDTNGHPQITVLKTTHIRIMPGQRYGEEMPPVESHGSGVVIAPRREEEDYDKVFTRVQHPARFPDGEDAWQKYLEKNLKTPLASDTTPVGNYTVKVQFIVDKTGAISNVQAIEVPKACPACVPEAVKVIKRGPPWEPAIQNGRKVIYQATQTVNFEVN